MLIFLKVPKKISLLVFPEPYKNPHSRTLVFDFFFGIEKNLEERGGMCVFGSSGVKMESSLIWGGGIEV